MVLGSTTEERGGVMRLRPHHLIDIITDYGHGRRFAPHPYGHAVHSVAQRIVDDPDIEIEFVLRADDICSPCCHLQADGQCDDVLRQLDRRIDLIIDGGSTPGRRASTVVDLTTNPERVLRSGPISASMLRRFLPDLEESL